MSTLKLVNLQHQSSNTPALVLNANNLVSVTGNTLHTGTTTFTGNIVGNVTSTGNITATDFKFANGASVLSAAAGNPTGTIINYASTTAPTGYLACDGTVYLRSSYGALANVIGPPTMPSSYTAEYANTTWITSPIIIVNGVAFASPGTIAPSTSGITSFLGGIYTSTDGTTWTARTAKPILYSPTGPNVINVGSTYVTTANVYPNQRGLAAFSPSAGAGLTPNGGQILQTSTDLATWTARSITLAAWAGVPSGATSMVGITNITSGGTVANRILLTMFFQGATYCSCGGVYVAAGGGSKANTAVSDDYGATWSFSNNLPATTGNANNSNTIQAASSSAGFVLTQSNVAFWSSNGQYWQDITANLRTALGVTSSSVSVVFYNVSQANNQFIIPTTGNRFLIAPSSNGSNGNWTTINVETNPSGAEYATSMAYFSADKIIHNGSSYFYNYPGNYLLFSNDLRYWFKKEDLTYASSTFSQYNALAFFPSGKGLIYSSAKTILSFTANGGYTAATQFPVPKISNYNSTLGYPAFNVPGTSVVPYIKT
jgi:hypothetical protein